MYAFPLKDLLGDKQMWNGKAFVNHKAITTIQLRVGELFLK